MNCGGGTGNVNVEIGGDDSSSNVSILSCAGAIDSGDMMTPSSC